MFPSPFSLCGCFSFPILQCPRKLLYLLLNYVSSFSGAGMLCFSLVGHAGGLLRQHALLKADASCATRHPLRPTVPNRTDKTDIDTLQ